MANFNYNKVILGGRLGADPELKTTPSGVSVCQFDVAVNRKERPKDGQQPKADFFTVVAWRQQAEFVTRYFRKGSSISITGTLQNRQWTTQNGEKRYKTEIVAQEIDFVDSKGESQSQFGQPNPYERQNQYAQQPPVAPQFEELGDDEELPF